MEEAIRLQAPPVTTIAAYQNYFVNNILNLVDATWQLNVTNFFVQFPITAHALVQIRTNFENNIREACRRIYNDRLAIALLFSDQYTGLVLNRLVKIVSTGSDFHKGGRQVLILTFDATWTTLGFISRNLQLRVVYKPADLEIDYLLAGIAAAAQRAAPAGNFQQQSLAEIFNAQVDLHPAAGLEKLPVYRILPCNPTSAAGGRPGTCRCETLTAIWSIWPTGKRRRSSPSWITGTATTSSTTRTTRLPSCRSFTVSSGSGSPYRARSRSWTCISRTSA